MIVSTKKKFIFFAVGKTGSTSIEASLSEFHDGHELVKRVDENLRPIRKKYRRPFRMKHMRPAFVRSLMDTDEWNSYFKFAFVRNPWDWVVSQICGSKMAKSRSAIQQLKPSHLEYMWRRLRFRNQSMDHANYFQHPFVWDLQGNDLLNFVGRFESIDNDFAEGCSRIGIAPRQLSHKNKGNHPHYRSMYTKEMRNLVAERYSEDIRLLGYSF